MTATRRTNGAGRPINGAWLEADVSQILVPAQKAGDVIIKDDLFGRKRSSARARIGAQAQHAFPPTVHP